MDDDRSYLEKIFVFVCSLPNMFHKLKTHSLFHIEKNPIDVNRNSRLCGLPFPIIESIVEAMDEYTIIKMRMTCESMNRKLEKFSEKIKQRTVSCMYMQRRVLECENCKYMMWVGVGDVFDDDGYGFSRFSQEDEWAPADPSVERLDGLHICMEQSFLEWFAELPINTNLDILQFMDMKLNKKKLDALLEIILRRNIRAWIIHLMYNKCSDHRALVRVLSSLRPSALEANWDSAKDCREFLSRTVLNYISTVEMFSVQGLEDDFVRVPRHSLKFPPMFYFAKKGVLVNINTLKRVMHAWFLGQRDIYEINVCLPPIFRRADLLAAALRLFPDYVRDSSTRNEIGYTNERGESCRVERRRGKNVFGDSSWRIAKENVAKKNGH